jgi:positive regulator of sigma E activity
MQSSTFIAKLVGPMLVVIGVGMLTNQDTYHAIIGEFLHSGALVYLSGLLSLLAGIAIVTAHNSWRAEWSVIITILGWLMVIGGIVRIVFPYFTVSLGTTAYGSLAAVVIVGIVGLVIGGFLTFKGYSR